MHILQSKYWREVKESLGNETFEFSGGFAQTTTLPYINKKIGYVPRIDITKLNVESLYQSAKKIGCSYVTVDPLNEDPHLKIKSSYKLKKAKPVHLRTNIIVDLQKSEEEILNSMDRKYRYNIRLAEKKGIKIEINNTNESFEKFLSIYLETKQRQKFFGRNDAYLRTVWEIMKKQEERDGIELVQIAIASFENVPLVAWMIFLYDGVVYYPYGGSIDLHREKKPTYLIVWEVFKWAKSKGYKTFDFWGIEEDYAKSGFSNFKMGFGGKIVKYSESFNLVINPLTYNLLQMGLLLREKIKFIKVNI